jgi:U3 small nucleolar RNA-associated protein 14
MKLGRQSIPSNKRKGVLSRPKSRAHANVVGYEKRLARKALKKSNNPITDLYEHAQVPEKKARRSKVTLDLGSDEEFEIRDGEGDEGDDDERERLKARLIGENEDDEKIDSDDDEELDSDAAFEESDEERFEEFFSRKAHDEDAELSDQESSSSDADSASEEENLDFDPSDDEEMPEALDILDNFVSNLDVTSRKRKVTSGIAIISTPVSEDVSESSGFGFFKIENFVCTSTSEDSGTAGSRGGL